MTRPILFRPAVITLAAAVTGAVFGGLALKAAAGRGDLVKMPWSAVR